MPAPNQPIAIMAADVNAQTLVLRETVSDYPSALLWIPPRLQLPKRCVPAAQVLYTKERRELVKC